MIAVMTGWLSKASPAAFLSDPLTGGHNGGKFCWRVVAVVHVAPDFFPPNGAWLHCHSSENYKANDDKVSSHGGDAEDGRRWEASHVNQVKTHC